MGQQQLLLLVLATVIVGLATVAGIQAFEQGSKRANQDALTQTAVKIATDVQAHLQEPAQFGGAGASTWSEVSSSGTSDVSLSDMGYSSPYNTTDGECTLSDDVSGNMTTDPNGGTYKIAVYCDSDQNDVAVGIHGFDDDGLSTVQE